MPKKILLSKRGTAKSPNLCQLLSGLANRKSKNEKPRRNDQKRSNFLTRERRETRISRKGTTRIPIARSLEGGSPGGVGTKTEEEEARAAGGDWSGVTYGEEEN